MDKEKECEHINIHAEYKNITIANAPPGSVGAGKPPQTFVLLRCGTCNKLLRIFAWNELT